MLLSSVVYGFIVLDVTELCGRRADPDWEAPDRAYGVWVDPLSVRHFGLGNLPT